MDVVTGVELEYSYGAGDGWTRSEVASMPKERSGRPRLDWSCDWEKYGYDKHQLYICRSIALLKVLVVLSTLKKMFFSLGIITAVVTRPVGRPIRGGAHPYLWFYLEQCLTSSPSNSPVVLALLTSLQPYCRRHLRGGLVLMSSPPLYKHSTIVALTSFGANFWRWLQTTLLVHLEIAGQARGHLGSLVIGVALLGMSPHRDILDAFMI